MSFIIYSLFSQFLYLSGFFFFEEFFFFFVLYIKHMDDCVKCVHNCIHFKLNLKQSTKQLSQFVLIFLNSYSKCVQSSLCLSTKICWQLLKMLKDEINKDEINPLLHYYVSFIILSDLSDVLLELTSSITLNI